MAIVRWTPYRDLGNWQKEVDEWFGAFGFPNFVKRSEKGEWFPPVDIRETKEGYELEAELPGLSKEDIKITLQEDVLQLQGERKIGQEVKEGGYHHRERMVGGFTRSFQLPGQVDVSKAQAEYKDGILRLSLPKTEGAQSRQIQIH